MGQLCAGQRSHIRPNLALKRIRFGPIGAMESRVFSRPCLAIAASGGEAMDWDRIEGNWKHLSGKIKEKWSKLTDDDIAAIDGRRETLEGKIQQRYGFASDHVR